ncbi:hypothetical protein CERZMDRAFT_56957 [Cercospora zeae-maydis SCOH1-5]|uniref:Uncharacterized protein n=1 Tax=Cercospora zeae-maydis SCOH1-5 TaxID=717836 RepID=A0A6A6FPI9_9PEZI|nr:hypothetical protein CERZMDRAFT_56957 [Cercospora zeae-maydis SCOH1-5]
MTDARLCSLLTLDDFLCFDGPTGVVVAQDDSRTSFFHHLGLQENTYRHRVLYRKMKAEAKAGMRRLFSDPRSLDQSVARGKTITPPYTVKQLSELAFQREVENIYHNASRQTRGIYDITRTANGHNWVIRWMLWHVIQAQHADEHRATSSAGEDDRSVTSPCSDATCMDWSPANSDGLMRSKVPWTKTVVTQYETSDSEDWENDYQTRIQITSRKPRGRLDTPTTPRKPTFWDHVMT